MGGDSEYVSLDPVGFGSNSGSRIHQQAGSDDVHCPGGLIAFADVCIDY